MSRIDELIADSCPDGVEFIELGRLVGHVQSVDWDDVGDAALAYVDLSSVDRQTHRIREAETITASTAPSRARQVLRTDDVVFGTTRPLLKRHAIVPDSLDGQVASTGFCVLRPHRDRLLSSFLFHILGTARFYEFVERNERGASYPAIPDSVIKRFKIPLPPVEIQRDIVAVLDKFTQLEAELEVELEVELEARRRQYWHYRDSLLSFREAGGVRWLPMGELGTIFGGLAGKSKADFTDGNARFVSYVNVFRNISTDTSADDYVRVHSAERQRTLQRGDLLFTASSENAAEVGMSSVITSEVDGPLFLNSFCIGVRPRDLTLLEPGFAKHLLRGRQMRDQIVRTASGVTRFNVSKSKLAKVMVPLPQPQEQSRIARQLDRFDALVSDLSIRLPAELAARRIQYEHYRDRLLTFAEAA